MREEAVVELAQSLFYEKALVKFEGEWIGAVAAIARSHPGSQHDLNYGEIFIRDNVPVMVYLLLQGKHGAVRHFLETCLQLQSDRLETRGIFPTSFVEANGRIVADYGQRAIGRVVSVDATLWWAVLAHTYVQRSGDRAFACQPQVQLGIQRFLELILHPSFREAPTLFVPDGAFMIDRPMDVWGAPLEIQVLLYGSLLSAAGLMRIALAEGSGETEKLEQQLHLCINYARRLRRYVLKQYWVNSKTVQVLRRRPTEQYGDAIENEYNIQTETIPHWLQDWLGNRGGYLIGNIRTGRPDFRFFTLGNCLGAMFDLISVRQQTALFRLVLQNQNALVAQMPLRICHPPLSDVDWRRKTGYDRKNLPWCYHNAGHWPCLLWFLVAAALRQQPHHQDALAAEMNAMLETAYERLLTQLPRQNWAEYFDGPTGTWMGQQARLYQTWTIVGFLLVHHFLKVNPADAAILDVPHLRDFRGVM
ncbi:glycoside hydrolase 100 family protein [Phormidium tenue FACHB-886]|nr:glycoside hydrolase 100 family protein [Phormidium tenue FACHB-886]